MVKLVFLIFLYKIACSGSGYAVWLEMGT